MKEPKTVKGYLKMLIEIANHSAYDLKNVTKDEARFIGIIRGSIQNELGEDEFKILEKYNLKF